MLYYAEINYCTMGLGKKNYMPPCRLTMGFAVMFKVPNIFVTRSFIHLSIMIAMYSIFYFVVSLNLYYFSLMSCVSVNTRMKE